MGTMKDLNSHIFHWILGLVRKRFNCDGGIIGCQVNAVSPFIRYHLACVLSRPFRGTNHIRWLPTTVSHP
jgi:hypothetical protein